MKKTEDYNKEELNAYERGQKVALADMLERLSPTSGIIFREETFGSGELRGFAILAINDLQERLVKARKTYKVQADMISMLNQLTID